MSGRPFGMIDGPNEYCYVSQNPWTKFDPEGLSWAGVAGLVLQQYVNFNLDAAVGVGNELGGVAKGVWNDSSALGTRVTNDAWAHLDNPGAIPLAAASDLAGSQQASVLAASEQIAAHPSSLGAASGKLAEDAWNSLVSKDGYGQFVGQFVLPALAGGGFGEGVEEVNLAAKGLSKEAPGTVSQVATVNCFVAGTLVSESNGVKKIEDIAVGERVLSTDSEDQRSDTDVKPKTWKEVTLTLDKEQDHAVVVAIRSPDWIEQNRPKVGSQIWFNLTDVDLSGWARVVSIADAPPFNGGKGRVVLTTIRHSNGEIYKLTLNHGEPVEVTPGHLIWSETHKTFVHACDLKPGERVRSRDDKLNLVVVGGGLEHRHAETYNLEVEADHHYFVGSEQLLVHNASPSPVVEALFQHQNDVFYDVNPTARQAAGLGITNPELHAETGSMLQSYAAGNRGGVGKLYVEGLDICGYCLTNIKNYARDYLHLDELHVEEATTGRNFIFDKQALRKIDDGGSSWKQAEVTPPPTSPTANN